MTSSIVYIYGLSDPDDPDAERYIGQSIAPEARLKQHIIEARSGLTAARAVWIRSLLSRGLAPTMRILATTIEEEAHRVEAELIARHLQTTALVNTLHTSRPRPPRKAKAKVPAMTRRAMRPSTAILEQITALARKERRSVSQLVSLLIEDGLMARRRPDPQPDPAEEK